MKLYKKYTTENDCLVINDNDLASDNLLRFRCNVLERILKVIMKVD